MKRHLIVLRDALARFCRARTYAYRLRRAAADVAWFRHELACVQRDHDIALTRYAAVEAEAINIDYPTPPGIARWTA